ncbi:responsive to abscisic acid 28 [Hibiscus trionum]|uniref:Responsive to abscisic acid 28 n=1 Tax=Hibiscus trionum TaxID=183268 RepID=A0A9W7IVJ9_HIBTR|nr:responsive to abscisic acid 28 [Hibiscus trionum]
MSQGQPRRPQESAQGAGNQQDPIKYGDVFNVSGELADKPIAPQDAAMMQTAETQVLGQTQKGGTAAVMQAAATRNEQVGVVGHNDITDIAGEQGVSVAETDVGGRRIITESVAGQVVGQYVQAVPVLTTQVGAVQQSAITIGEALEATAKTAGDKPVDQSDAAAIQAAEVRATGSNVIIPGGLASTAQSAAAHNATLNRDEDKIKLNQILTGATARLPADKAVTRQDAEGVVGAELRNNPNVATHPGGVAASVAAAARLNENVNI